MRRHAAIISYVLLLSLVLCACGQKVPDVNLNELDLGSAENTIASLNVSAPGTRKDENEEAVIDYSNTEDGYIMVKYKQDTDTPIKAQVKCEDVTYTYDLIPGQWSAFPLSEGDGEYQVCVYSNIGGTKYALVLSSEFDVELKDEFAPFLRPNQYVNFAEAPHAVALAAELTRDDADTLEKVESVYEYVIHTLTYDKYLAETVKSGYLPVLDSVLEKKSGICFDYAALMTGMLRSLGIPCKLVIGYAGSAYHAWISVWVDGVGWIDNLVYFDGINWQLMDPTFASAGSSNYAFIGDGKNYSAKYFY